MDTDENILSAIAAKLMNRATLTKFTDEASSTFAATRAEASPTFPYLPSAMPDVMSAQDTVMTDGQDGPPLRGTAEQLQLAREALNTRMPKLHRTKSVGGIARRPATALAHQSPESRRYHPQMNIPTVVNNKDYTASGATVGKAPVQPKAMLADSSLAIRNVTNSQFSLPTAGHSASFGDCKPDPVVPDTNVPNQTEPAQLNVKKMSFSIPTPKSSNGIKPDVLAAEAIASGPRDVQIPEDITGVSAQNEAKQGHENGSLVAAGAVAPTAITRLEVAVTTLRREIFEWSRRFELIVEGEQRRKFLGTDQAKTPYEVFVVCSGRKVTVQADATMKVADLIRRIRFRCDVTPEQSMNPRITFNSNQIGHGLTLGEAGITSKSEVHFTFDES